MKAILIFFMVLIIGITCQGQPAQADTSKKFQMPPDSLPIISIRDAKTFYLLLRKISHDDYEKLKPEDVLDGFMQWAIEEYRKKKKK